MNGVHFPAVEGCPECGHDRLYGVENCKQGCSIGLDGQGGVAHFSPDEVIETTYSYLECANCEAMLVEDGEIVHDALE